MSNAESEIRATPHLANVWQVAVRGREERRAWALWGIYSSEARARSEVDSLIIEGIRTPHDVRIVRYDLAEVLS